MANICGMRVLGGLLCLICFYQAQLSSQRLHPSKREEERCLNFSSPDEFHLSEISQCINQEMSPDGMMQPGDILDLLRTQDVNSTFWLVCKEERPPTNGRRKRNADIGDVCCYVNESECYLSCAPIIEDEELITPIVQDYGLAARMFCGFGQMYFCHIIGEPQGNCPRGVITTPDPSTSAATEQATSGFRSLSTTAGLACGNLSCPFNQSHENETTAIVSSTTDGANGTEAIAEDNTTTSANGTETIAEDNTTTNHADERIMVRVVGDGCHTVNAENGTLHSPNFPNEYPSFTSCSWIITAPEHERIKLTFTAFDFEWNGRCTSDYLAVFDGPTRNSRVFGRYCGHTLPPPLSSSSNTMTLIMWTDYEDSYTGFSAKYRIAPGCGGNITSETGVLESPNYPNIYGMNEMCIWLITVTENYRVVLRIRDFQLEDQTSCGYDYLEVHDGHGLTAPSLGRFCGSYVTEVIKSSGNLMRVVFRSDASNYFRGFHAEFEQVPGCGGKVTSGRGVLRSPNYPNAYSPDQLCTWQITVPENYIVVLRFLSFELESHVTCTYDYLEVYDGRDVSAPLLGMFCGTNVTKVIKSSGNQMTVKFRSDRSNQHKGFDAEFEKELIFPMISSGTQTVGYFTAASRPVYGATSRPVYGATNRPIYVYGAARGPIYVYGTTSRPVYAYKAARMSHLPYVCGENITAGTGELRSPNYPNSYGSFESCNWVITVPENYRVVLRFLSFELESSPRCMYDYVEVRDGHDLAAPLLGKFCGTNVTEVIKSSGNQMTVSFQSDSSDQYEGFFAEFEKESLLAVSSSQNRTFPSGVILLLVVHLAKCFAPM